MSNRIFWQVKDYNEHDIPEGSRVVIQNNNTTVEVWIDEEGIVVQEIIDDGDNTSTDIRTVGE